MGDTVLHYAAYKSMKKLITYLLQRDANPYIENYVQIIDILEVSHCNRCGYARNQGMDHKKIYHNLEIKVIK